MTDVFRADGIAFAEGWTLELDFSKMQGCASLVA
jgi:hypothetical protein